MTRRRPHSLHQLPGLRPRCRGTGLHSELPVAAHCSCRAFSWGSVSRAWTGVARLPRSPQGHPDQSGVTSPRTSGEWARPEPPPPRALLPLEPHDPLASLRPVHPHPAFSCSSPYKLWTLRTAEAEVAGTQGCPVGEHLHLILPQPARVCYVSAGACHPRAPPSPAPCPAPLTTATPRAVRPEPTGAPGALNPAQARSHPPPNPRVPFFSIPQLKLLGGLECRVYAEFCRMSEGLSLGSHEGKLRPREVTWLGRVLTAWCVPSRSARSIQGGSRLGDPLRNSTGEQMSLQERPSGSPPPRPRACTEPRAQREGRHTACPFHL